MSIYLNSEITPSEDGLSSTQLRAVPGKTGTILDGELNLVDDGEKSLKSQTKPELVDTAKGLGIPADVAENLTKAELLESISRLTHTNDD